MSVDSLLGSLWFFVRTPGFFLVYLVIAGVLYWRQKQQKKRWDLLWHGKRLWVVWPSNDAFLRTNIWRETREKVLFLLKPRCCACGRGLEQGAVLTVDHIIPRHIAPFRALDLNNLQILCAEDNQGKWGKHDPEHDYRTQEQKELLAAKDYDHQVGLKKRMMDEGIRVDGNSADYCPTLPHNCRL